MTSYYNGLHVWVCSVHARPEIRVGTCYNVTACRSSSLDCALACTCLYNQHVHAWQPGCHTAVRAHNGRNNTLHAQKTRPASRAASATALTRPWYLYPARSNTTFSMPFSLHTSATALPTSSAAACTERTPCHQRDCRCAPRAEQILSC